MSVGSCETVDAASLCYVKNHVFRKAAKYEFEVPSEAS
jgi:hypothetical protein